MYLAKTRLVLSSFFHHIQIEDDLPMKVIAPQGEVAKALAVVRLSTHKLLVSGDAVVGLEILVASLGDKHMVTVLPNLVLVLCLQRLEDLVPNITGVKPQVHYLQDMCPHPPSILIPSNNNMNFLTNPPLKPAGPGASR